MAGCRKMSRNPEDVFKYAAEISSNDVKTIKRYWKYIQQAIVHVAHFDGVCQIDNLATIKVRASEPKKDISIDRDGTLVETTLPPVYTADVKLLDSFIDDLNGRGVTKSYKKRVKEKKLTEHDLERIVRMDVAEEAREAKVRWQAAQRDQNRMNFIEEIQRKKKEHEDKMNEKDRNDPTSN